jgi:two-component system LytT family response regulator
MLRPYVVDDEPLAVKRLTRMLEATGRVELAGSTSDPDMALAFLRDHAVDVLFLDIQMPGLTGFELLEQLDQQPLVIFTTAYDRYALEAFEVNSIDYLLKPIEPERLDRALEKAVRVGGTGARTGTSADTATSTGSATPYGDPSPVPVRELARLLAAHLAPNRRLERIASRVGERTTVLDVARVSHFLARDKLTFAVVNGREHVVDYTLAELEDRLEARRFVRIHRATIANLGFVQELFPDVDGGVLIRLKDDQKTELSGAGVERPSRDLKGRPHAKAIISD